MTERIAAAESIVYLGTDIPELKPLAGPPGPILDTAIIAAPGSKKTAELIPFTPNLQSVKLTTAPVGRACASKHVKVLDQTGVEMEALTAALRPH